MSTLDHYASPPVNRPPSWARRVAVVGYSAKGLVYVAIGLLAARAAAMGGRAVDARGLLWTLFERPLGVVLLGAVAAGLAAYACWRGAQAFADTERRGRDLRGLLTRGAYLASGVLHAGLVVASARILFGLARRRRHPGDANVRSWTALLMAQPAGRWLVAGVGVAVGLFALYQLRRAWTGDLTDEGDLSSLATGRHHWTVRFGRIGAAARAVVFLVVGGWLVVAGANADPGDARGLGGALAGLALRPYGRWLMAAVAAGLCAYGLYELAIAAHHGKRGR